VEIHSLVAPPVEETAVARTEAIGLETLDLRTPKPRDAGARLVDDLVPRRQVHELHILHREVDEVHVAEHRLLERLCCPGRCIIRGSERDAELTPKLYRVTGANVRVPVSGQVQGFYRRQRGPSTEATNYRRRSVRPVSRRWRRRCTRTRTDTP
jgi:hypothetical protein